MGWLKTVKDTTAELRAAQAALNAQSRRERAAGVDDETAEYRRLNAAVQRASETRSDAVLGRGGR